VEASLALRSLSVSAVYEDSRANLRIWDREERLPDKQDDFIEKRYEKSDVHPRYYATLYQSNNQITLREYTVLSIYRTEAGRL
jgi:hypothetical protein